MVPVYFMVKIVSTHEVLYLVNILTVLIGAAVILLIDVRLSLLALVSLPVFAVVYGSFRVRLRRVWRRLARQRAGMYGLARDRLASPETVKSFGQERREAIRLFTTARELLVSCYGCRKSTANRAAEPPPLCVEALSATIRTHPPATARP